ncbi:MAG: tetratricopeptide repeat protein, partial [candidate division Zixibacteria bacterium]|nr:tetratricopeptide repeat protein [candidate division Zixibacteria bacterium]
YAACQQLSKRQLSDDMMEQVDFHLALVLFFERQFDSARAGFQKLMVEYPRGFYVNDALELLLLMDEAEPAPELLYDYSSALLFEERRLLDSTVARLNGIVDAENKAIADIALYRLATILLDAADTSAALGKIDRLADEFPESYYLPYGMKTKADIYFLNPDSLDRAREIYQNLLENFPEYPFISEVRKKMRQADVI